MARFCFAKRRRPSSAAGSTLAAAAPSGRSIRPRKRTRDPRRSRPVPGRPARALQQRDATGAPHAHPEALWNPPAGPRLRYASAAPSTSPGSRRSKRRPATDDGAPHPRIFRRREPRSSAPGGPDTRPGSHAPAHRPAPLTPSPSPASPPSCGGSPSSPARPGPAPQAPAALPRHRIPAQCRMPPR